MVKLVHVRTIRPVVVLTSMNGASAELAEANVGAISIGPAQDVPALTPEFET